MVCVAKCPKFWELNQSTGKVHLKKAKEKESNIFYLEISEEDYKCNKLAANNCPKNAISIKKLK